LKYKVKDGENEVYGADAEHNGEKKKNEYFFFSFKLRKPLLIFFPS